VIEAQVDYGENPEGGGSGKTRTVRVDARAMEGIPRGDRAWLHCRRPALESGGCEQSSVDGTRLLYRWYPGMEEEEPGSYSWTVVRASEVVTVAYEGSGQFESDPRDMGLAVEPADLRAAALDPAMSLRTTTAYLEAGRDLDHYEGVEVPPEKPTVVPTTPKELADRAVDYLGRRPTSIRRSRLRDFGPDSVGVHMEFASGRKYDAFSVDVITTVGRVPQIDPLPCAIQKVATAVKEACFAWGEDSAATWTLASEGRPGVLWIIGAQDDDKFNRVESVGIRVVSTGIDRPFFVGSGPTRVPESILADLEGFTGDLGVGPERWLAD
jgi:hypothetical protein